MYLIALLDAAKVGKEAAFQVRCFMLEHSEYFNKNHMEKFLVLYMAPIASVEAMMKDMTPEQGKEGMEEWTNWMNERKESFVDMGAPAGKTKRVTASSIEDIKNDVTGYSIVQAESHEAAAKVFENMPHFQIRGAYVEVMRLADMGKM